LRMILVICFSFFEYLVTRLCMISLRVLTTNLVNKNLPEKMPSEFSK
jgi:hypothetical protein